MSGLLLILSSLASGVWAGLGVVAPAAIMEIPRMTLQPRLYDYMMYHLMREIASESCLRDMAENNVDPRGPAGRHPLAAQ